MYRNLFHFNLHLVIFYLLMLYLEIDVVKVFNFKPLHD